MTAPGRCVRSTSDARIKVSANGRSFEFKNERGVSVDLIIVDGCAIDVGERCDYLYRVGGKEIYVELKGSDIRKAVAQIGQSVKVLSIVAQRERAAVVVSSRVPKEDTSTMLAKLRLLRDSVATLKVKNGYHVLGVGDL